MARQNQNTEPKPKLRKISGKPKPKPKSKPTAKPGGKRPKTPAEEEVMVSRSIMRRHSGRGGRGR